jgi:hypothetical protein
MKLPLQLLIEHFLRFRSDMAVDQVVIFHLEFVLGTIYQVFVGKLF